MTKPIVTNNLAKKTPQVNGLSVTESIDNLKQQIELETKKRKLLSKYIKDNLKEGEDYGKIHVMPKSKCDNPYNCTNSRHYSKNTLFKSGSEKFISLFHLSPKFRKDPDTWEMLGSKPGVVCYVCELFT